MLRQAVCRRREGSKRLRGLGRYAEGRNGVEETDISRHTTAPLARVCPYNGPSAQKDIPSATRGLSPTGGKYTRGACKLPSTLVSI